MNIILVRHGQTDWNVQDLLQGRTDIELNETGKKQAEETADKLIDIKVDAIYVSPLKRTIDTANQINKTRNMELKVDSRLIERSFGNYEGKSKVEFRKYWELDLNASDNEVEPIKELFSRAENLLRELNRTYAKNETVLLVTHNGMNLAITTILNGVIENIFEYNLKPCEYRIFNNISFEKWEKFNEKNKI